jgi:sec-independent protein translocase protein TatA
MGISFWQVAIVVVLVVLLFGRGKISALMGDLAKGIKSFKAGMQEDDTASKAHSEIDSEKAETVEATTTNTSAKDEAAKS